ncbi:unnamed protein product [Caenorhabditis sp. 36 PRJEB53466]|nr:unnamed protein product [Caenorhabditis sp. 36 PRJEB53466]
MSTTSPQQAVDFSKLVFNPLTITYEPVDKKQVVIVDVTNNNVSHVALHWKTNVPRSFRSSPARAKLAPGERMAFKCYFFGMNKEQYGNNAKMTVICVAILASVPLERAFEARGLGKLKHTKMRIPIMFRQIKTPDDETMNNNQKSSDEKDEKEEGKGKAGGEWI